MSKSNADFSAFDFNDSSSDNSLQSRSPFLSSRVNNNSSSVTAVKSSRNATAARDNNLNGNDNDDDDDNNPENDEAATDVDSDAADTNDANGVAGFVIGNEADDGGTTNMLCDTNTLQVAAATTTNTNAAKANANSHTNNNNMDESNPLTLEDGLHVISNVANGNINTNTSNNNAEGLQLASDGGNVPTTTSGASDANPLDCGVATLLDGALSNCMNNSSTTNNNNNNTNNNNNNNSNNNNCNELARSSSASLSNNSASTMLGAGGGSGGNPGVAGNSTSASDRKKYRHQNYSKNIYIGTKNAEKWEHSRTRLQFKNDVEFVAYLLNLADNDTERLANLPELSAPTTPTKSFAGNFKLEPNLSVKEFSNSQTENGDTQPIRKKSKKRVQFSDTLNGLSKIKDFSNFAMKAKKHDQKMKPTTTNSSNTDLLPEVLDCRIAEKIKSELEEKTASRESLPNALCLKKNDEFPTMSQRSDDEDDEQEQTQGSSVAANVTDIVDGPNGQNKKIRTMGKNKKKLKQPMVPPPLAAVNNALHGLNSNNTAPDEDDDDIDESDGADDDDEEMDEEALAREMKNEQNFVEEEDEHDIAFRSQQACRECSLAHDYKVCPLHNAIGIITDAVDLGEWIERKNLEALAKMKSVAQRQAKHDNDDEDMDETSQMSELETKPLITFAEASVPAEFELHNVEPNVTGVFARTEVRAFTKLGPLIGQPVNNNDVREASDMKWIFEICEAGAEKSQLLSCDNPNTSNWLRYIRPAPVYEERNVNLVSIERQAFFVTCRDVKNGMELLYWSDDCNTMWRKKHTEKTNCGGCNLKFEHPLYYRTHCSIFHDPSMSLTIRKYHCKVCGDAVLGKDNIMKHAAEMHEGKGAYQCQFCNKFFLRLNYLEMHRTYGCAANPNRARPLCDFCGRKFCQPQKLKAHIKRMHSDMADVLRDFQCKLCSKLLGSRAALQRHSKEVHSRNSTVVSCPRCQKLFQNRSNLKIHMLTHSGVRPFKCAEPECNAAFTTKQCLQFHYKKVHNYSQEQMPKIERSVAYTFDAYSGGMKVDFLEQAPRRRRKSLEDQNSLLSSSMLDSKSDTEFSDDNIFEAIKKSGKSIKDLCRNEPNLSLLSSKISSIFGEKVVGSRKRKKKNFRANDPKEQPPTMMGEEDDEDERMEHVRRKQNAQLSLVESFLSTTAHRLTAQQQVQQVVAAAAAVSAMAGGGQSVDEANKMHMLPPGLNPQQMAMAHGGPPVLDNDEDDEDDEDDDDEHDGMHPPGQQSQHDPHGGYRHHAGIVSPMTKESVAGMNALGQNLVVSKGSKKWISGDDRHLQRDCASVDRCSMGNSDVPGAQVACGMSGTTAGANDMGIPGFAVPPGAVDDPSKLIGQNRDFLARLMSSANANHTHHNANTHEPEDENSSFLDVVESNVNANATAQMAQYHHNGGNAGPSSAGTTSSSGAGSVIGVANSGTGNQSESAQQLQMNALAHTQSFMSSFYNNANSRLGAGAGASASTSASMLVEAALNSVGNMIDNDSSDLKVPNEANINNDSPMGDGGGGSQVETESNRFSANSNNNAINSMDNLENELKMMKNLSNFPMQMAPLPMFPNSGQNMNSCNISPDGSTPANPQSNQNQNEVDVDAGSTPRGQHMNAGATDSNGFSSGHHRTPPTPQPISPGRDYGMFGANGTNASSANAPGTSSSTSSGNSVGNGGNNNISASSPLPTMQSQRRNASSVGSSYPEHELISPASSPSIPRYNFNGDMMRHKRAEVENERRHNISGHNQLSSDEENSILPQNSAGQDMRMKFTQSQMDLMYSKYESMANATNLKYNSQELETSEFRGSNNSAANDMSDLQGLDMSSRSNVGASNYHHNFQLPSSASSNISNIGRYHHHIYDILSEREQNQQQQQQSQQQQHHSSATSASGAHHQQSHASQLAMQQHQSSMHNMLPDQLNDQEHDQTTSVDLSRTANYVVSSPPQLAYNHPHHDMLRMASLDLTPNTNMSVGNNRSFLTSQMQHQSRESLEHHRLLSTVEQHRILAASNAAAADQHRLLVDPTAHLLMEQNNRLLGTADQSRLLGETAQNRHMARGFGAYHQVTSGNYHPGVRPPVLPSPNHHASNPSNYHPFPAYY